MESKQDRIRLPDAARAALRRLPSALEALRATLKVYALRPDSPESMATVLESFLVRPRSAKKPGCL